TPRVSAQSTQIPNGYTLVDGDMLLPTRLVESLLKQPSNRLVSPRASYATNWWPNGIVPFEFDANCGVGSTTCVTLANQTAMVSAMGVLQNAANVAFQQCANNTCAGNSVHIQNSTTGNNSQVGVQGGKQIINIISWNSQFIMVHELLHCLGLFHEHQR